MGGKLDTNVHFAFEYVETPSASVCWENGEFPLTEQTEKRGSDGKNIYRLNETGKCPQVGHAHSKLTAEVLQVKSVKPEVTPWLQPLLAALVLD